MKPILKSLFHLICSVLTYPFVIFYKVNKRLSSNDSLFTAIGQLLSLWPGKTGSYMRASFYSNAISSFSRSTYVGFGSYFPHPEIHLEKGIYIGAYCIIGKATIGKDTIIGSHVNILSGKEQHRFEDIDRPLSAQGGAFHKVEIGENCWIGNGAIIMANVGRQCVIGAGSVVTKSTGDYVVLAGNPAKVIRTLK